MSRWAPRTQGKFLPKNTSNTHVFAGPPRSIPGLKLDAFVWNNSESFERIPHVGDTQAAWLLLSVCASPRAFFWFRSVNPDLTDGLT